MKRSKLQKFFSIALCFALLAVFTSGCGGENHSETKGRCRILGQDLANSVNRVLINLKFGGDGGDMVYLKNWEEEETDCPYITNPKYINSKVLDVPVGEVAFTCKIHKDNVIKVNKDGLFELVE